MPSLVTLGLAHILLSPTTIPVTQASAFSWHPDGKRLFIVNEKEVKEWPSGRCIPIHKPSDPEAVLEVGKIQWTGDGKRMLCSGTSAGAYVIVDLDRQVSKTVAIDYVCAWWIGDEVATVRTIGQSTGFAIYLAQRRKELPKNWQYTAVDGDQSVLLAKDNRWYLSPIAFYRVNPKTLHVTLIRKHKKRLFSEYGDQDSMDWNDRLGMGATGLTSDTGAVLSTLHLSAKQSLTTYPKTGDFFLTNHPQWVGNKLLVSNREFRESQKGKINYGADIYRVQLVDPRTGKAQTLAIENNRWIWDQKNDTNPSRLTQPGLYGAAATKDGKRIAWLWDGHGKKYIVMR